MPSGDELEERRHPRDVGCLERTDLIGGEFEVERGDRVAEVMGLRRPTIGASTTGFLSTHAMPTWAIDTPRLFAIVSAASTIALSLSRNSGRPAGSTGGPLTPRAVVRVAPHGRVTFDPGAAGA
jgi:hypothetical protein